MLTLPIPYCWHNQMLFTSDIEMNQATALNQEMLNHRAYAKANSLMNSLRDSPLAQEAISFCDKEINEYNEWYELNEKRWMLLQTVAIVAGVIATLAGVISFPIPKDWTTAPLLESLSWVRGIPAAIGTIATGLLGSFSYREDAVRHELTKETLRQEKIRFITRSSPYNKHDDIDTSTFVNKICTIVDSEARAWDKQVLSTSKNDRPHIAS